MGVEGDTPLSESPLARVHTCSKPSRHFGSFSIKSVQEFVGGSFDTVSDEEYSRLKKGFRDNYDVFISVTGAQISNQIFMKRGTKVIIIGCSHCLGDTVIADNSLNKPSAP